MVTGSIPKRSNDMHEDLAKEIMEVKLKMDTSLSFEAHQAFDKQYQELRKKWDQVAGKNIIGIEIKVPPYRKAA